MYSNRRPNHKHTLCKQWIVKLGRQCTQITMKRSGTRILSKADWVLNLFDASESRSYQPATAGHTIYFNIHV